MSKMSKDDKAKAEAQEKLLDQKNNAAVDELQSVVDSIQRAVEDLEGQERIVSAGGHAPRH